MSIKHRITRIENRVGGKGEFCTCQGTPRYEVIVREKDRPSMPVSVPDSCGKCGKRVEKTAIQIVGVPGNTPPADFKAERL